MRNKNKFSTPRSSPSQKQNAHYADLLQKYGNTTDIRNNKKSKHRNYIDDETVDKNLISSIFDTPKVIIDESIIDMKNHQYEKELTKKMNPRLTEDQKTSLIDRLSLSKVVVINDDHELSKSTPKKKYNGQDFNEKFINSRFEGIDPFISLTQLEIILRYFAIIDHSIDDRPLISQELLPLCEIDDQTYDSQKLKEALLQSFTKSSNDSFWLGISNCIKSARLNGKMKTYIRSPTTPNTRRSKSKSVSSRSHEAEPKQNEETQFSDDLSYTTDEERESPNYPNIFKDYVAYYAKEEPKPDQPSEINEDIVDKNSNHLTNHDQINEENEENQNIISGKEDIIEEEEEVENNEEQNTNEEQNNEEQNTNEEQNNKEQNTNEEEDIDIKDEKQQNSNEYQFEKEIKPILSEEAEYNDQTSQKEDDEIKEEEDQITSQKIPSQKKRKNFHQNPKSKQDPFSQNDEYEYNYYSEEQFIKSSVTFDDLIHDAADQPYEDKEFQSMAEEASYSKDFLSYDSIDYDNDDDLYIKVKTRRKSRHRKSPKSQAQSPVQNKTQNQSKSKSYCNRHHHHHHRHHNSHRDDNKEELFDRLKIVQPNQSEKADVAVQVKQNMPNENNSKETNSKFSSSEAGKYPLTVPIEDVDAEDLKQFEEKITEDQK